MSNNENMNNGITDDSDDYSFSYKYFENRECKYYPCHEKEHINCLFCYCPLHAFEHCPGTPKFVEKGDKVVKSCIGCTFPHEKENYDAIMKILAARK